MCLLIIRQCELVPVWVCEVAGSTEEDINWEKPLKAFSDSLAKLVHSSTIGLDTCTSAQTAHFNYVSLGGVENSRGPKSHFKLCS